MFLTHGRNSFKGSSLLSGIARRGNGSYGFNIFHPFSSDTSRLIESQPQPRRLCQRQKEFAESQRISRSTRQVRSAHQERDSSYGNSQSPSIKNAIRASTGDPPAGELMRITQPLSPNLLSNLSPTFQKFALKDKIAIVTGGARGLGLNMMQALCESGIKAVAIFDIQPALGKSIAQALCESTGIPVKYYNVDVVDENCVESAVDEVVQDFGGIDILVNSAGVAFSNIPAESYTIDDFSKTININLIGSFRVARAVGRRMMAATPTPTPNQKTLAAVNPTPRLPLPDRSIILVASMSGSIVNYPQPQCAYNASKAGVIQLSKSLAAEWSPHGIRVNTISPGYMDTALNRVPALDRQKAIWKDRTPMGRLGEVEELNNLVVWLAGEGSRFCTGSDLRVDGGYSVW